MSRAVRVPSCAVRAPSRAVRVPSRAVRAPSRAVRATRPERKPKHRQRYGQVPSDGDVEVLPTKSSGGGCCGRVWRCLLWSTCLAWLLGLLVLAASATLATPEDKDTATLPETTAPPPPPPSPSPPLPPLGPPRPHKHRTRLTTPPSSPSPQPPPSPSPAPPPEPAPPPDPPGPPLPSWPPPSPVPSAPPTPLHSPRPPPLRGLDAATCEALFTQEHGSFRMMWNQVGWRTLRHREGGPCWGDDGASSKFWDEAIKGTHCGEDWYQGSIGTPSRYEHDSPGLLGFDNSIDWFCGELARGRHPGIDPGQRRLDDVAGDDHRSDRGESNVSSGSATRRRRLDSARLCAQNSINILMLFAQNVHGTGDGYNSCRNLEWQICAARGMLPGQQSPSVIFAEAPGSLDVGGDRPLGVCGGYHPQGCGRQSYSNDDIYFLEVCVYAMICDNSAELFEMKVGWRFHCQINEDGFRRMQRYLTSTAPPPPI